MDRSAITASLLRGHEAFITRVLAVPHDQLDRSHDDKWTPAQHLEHIQRAIRPVALAILISKWFLRWRFGDPNRAPHDYEALVVRYKEKLAAGGKASGRFIPPLIAAGEVVRISASLERIVRTLMHRVDAWTEEDLDHYLLPHPLLGKLTVREMLFFTIYHVEHHQALLERD